MADDVPLEQTEQWAVEGWRVDRLRSIGVDGGEAIRLATDHTVDWHLIERLVRDGCPVRLAVKIAG